MITCLHVSSLSKYQDISPSQKLSHMEFPRLDTGAQIITIVVNDLPEAITSGDLFMFNDDTTIFTIGKNIDNIILTLQSMLDQVYTY